jgi:hypothetical protein
MRTKEASARKRKRKKRKKPVKEGLILKETLDEVSSDDNLCCQSDSVPKEEISLGKMKTNAASFTKRIEKKRAKLKPVKEGLIVEEALDEVSSDDNLDDFDNVYLIEDGELFNSSDY